MPVADDDKKIAAVTIVTGIVVFVRHFGRKRHITHSVGPMSVLVRWSLSGFVCVLRLNPTTPCAVGQSYSFRTNGGKTKKNKLIHLDDG